MSAYLDKFYRKRILYVCVFTTFFTLLSLFSRASAVDVSAKSAILIEADSGEVIFEKEADIKLPMASTTKIMTAVVALENADLDKVVAVSPKACGVEGSSIYLKPGDKLTMEDLLYSLLLQSANDAAAAIAYEVAGGIDEFAQMMNDKAAELGLKSTHFTNPHGLDNEAHYTTAHDLAKLTAYALKNESFLKIVSTFKHSIQLSSDENAHILVNHNKLLRLSKDVIGVKTGFTKRSGRCLVSAAERDGVRVIAVTLDASDDWNDHIMLHELGFSTYKRAVLATPGQYSVKIPCMNADSGYVTAVNRDEFSLVMKKDEDFDYRIEAHRIIFSDVCEGDILGKIIFTYDRNVVGELPLYSVDTVENADSSSFTDKILGIFN